MWATERCPEITPESYSTFWRRWYDRWYGVIMTRKKSQHAECQICNDYKHYIHYSHASPEDKCLAAKRWHEHLQAQYRDRLLYGNVRFWSRRSESNVLSIIIDSMDKTKAAWPQYTFKIKKELERFTSQISYNLCDRTWLLYGL